MAKKSLKSDKLAERIAALEAEMKAAKVAEHEAAERTLISLVRRAGCLDDAIKFARKALRERQVSRQAAAPAPVSDGGTY